jgi:hypothetical protein
MSQAVLPSTQSDLVLAWLEELIAILEHRNTEQVNLLVEHLHSARAYWLGAMPAEYTASLQDARDAAGRVEAKELRQPLLNTIDYLLTEMAHVRPPHENRQWHHAHLKQRGPTPPGVRSQLWQFFSGSDLSFGVFYPKRHIIAVFPSFEVAQQADRVMRNAGFNEQEIVAVRPEEMLQFLNELRIHAGLWGALMAPISQTFGTEKAFVDIYIRQGREGGGFLAIYSPEDGETDRIRQSLEPLAPLAMQRYTVSGIQSLV